MSISLLISPLTIALCRRKSTRLTAVMGGLITALGCLFTSFASQFHQLFLSYGILAGNLDLKYPKVQYNMATIFKSFMAVLSLCKFASLKRQFTANFERLFITLLYMYLYQCDRFLDCADIFLSFWTFALFSHIKFSKCYTETRSLWSNKKGDDFFRHSWDLFAIQ